MRRACLALLLCFACTCVRAVWTSTHYGPGACAGLRAGTLQQAPGKVPLDTVLKKVAESWESEPAKAVALIDEALTDLIVQDSSAYIAALQYRGRAQRLLGEYVAAIETWEIVHQYAGAHAEEKMLVEAARQLGSMNTYTGNYLEAQPYVLQVADIQNRIGTTSEKAGAMNGLAILYSNLGQEAAAIGTYQKALALYIKAKDTSGQSAIHANLGMEYMEQGVLDRAEYHLLAGGKLDSLVGTDYDLAYHYDFLANLRRAQGRIEEALFIGLKGLELRKTLPSHYNVAESNITVARALVKIGRYAEAIPYAQEVLDFKDEHQSLSQEESAYEILSEVHENSGNPTQALFFYKALKTVSDSIYRRDHLEEIATQNARYEKAKQDQEIALLGRQNALTAATLQRRNLALLAAGFCLLVLGIFSLVAWRLIRKISRQKATLQLLHNQKDTLLREIHHRVKNNLQLVSSLLSLQSDFIEDDAALDAIRMGQQRVRSMAIIHQRLYLRDALTTTVSAREYLEQLIGELMTTLNVKGLNLKLEKHLEDIELDIDRLIPLGLVANEVITNAMKHAFTGRENGRLVVTFRRAADQIELEITDDGLGFSTGLAGPKDSFGNLLIRTFTEQLEGELVMDGTNGTRVQLLFPA